MIITSHFTLAMIDYSAAKLNQIKPNSFKEQSKHAFEISHTIGIHFGRLAEIFNTLGKYINLSHNTIYQEFNFSFNDFTANKFYDHAKKSIDKHKNNTLPSLIMCLCFTNTALYILPKLDIGKNLLTRIQYLTVYHGISTIEKSIISPPTWVKDYKLSQLWSPKIRNIMAHYELRNIDIHNIDMQDPFMSIVEILSGQSTHDIQVEIHKYLHNISELLGSKLGKSDLRHIRALLGDHT